MWIEDVYRNAVYGKIYLEFKIYADEKKVDDVIDVIDKTLKSKLLQEGLVYVNMVDQEVFVTAVNCKEDDSCVMKVKAKAYDKWVGTKYYVVNGDDVRDIDKKEYNKLSILDRDSSKALVIKDIEYAIKNSEEAIKNEKFDYYVDDVDDCITEIKNNKNYRSKKISNKIKHWIHKIRVAIYKFTHNISKLFKKNIVHDSEQVLIPPSKQEVNVHDDIKINDNNDRDFASNNMEEININNKVRGMEKD